MRKKVVQLRCNNAAKMLMPAFSLVEMLMALLVASLLLAALAPVMTKRMADNEIKVMKESINYERDTIISAFDSDTNFTIPLDAYQVRVTMMGGGGKGGDALYGNKEFTTSQNFTVPDGVTKLRVFMIGGGGSGASGGQIKSWMHNDIPELNTADYSITTSGTYTFANKIVIPDAYKAPALHNYCTTSGTTNWVLISNNTNIAPNTKLSKAGGDGSANVTITKATACGAGGGSSNSVNRYGEPNTTSDYMAFGGSGGYLVNQTINYTAKPAAITFKVGEAGKSGTGIHWDNLSTTSCTGGAGGAGGTKGGNGGSNCSYAGVAYQAIAGGGGGGSTAILNSSNSMIFEAPGGGGAGGFIEICRASWEHGGSGGGGGGTLNKNVGWGGYPAGTISSSAGSFGYVAQAGTGSGGYAPGKTGFVQTRGTNDECQSATGGGGGGGIGGIGGGKGSLNSIFGTNNCNSGKPGAIKIWYNIPKVTNGLKCEYKNLANSGGGGGAGQIWLGEIDVTPKQVIKINIGNGGARTTAYNVNGNDGGATSVVVGGTSYSVLGGKGGKYETNNTYIVNSGGLGGGLNKNNLSSSARYKNWLNLDESLVGGKNGSQGNIVSGGANGGNGGTSYRFGTALNGGNGGTSQSNGTDASTASYGAGGGGGGGVTAYGHNPGLGGKGANGYVFIEWGGYNGGGGTAGEIVKTTLTNFDGDTSKRIMQIKIGRGGNSANSNGGETSISVISGGKTVTRTAKGGAAGNKGEAESHGLDKNLPDDFSELYKEYIQGNISIITGQKGTNDYGGMGGYLSCLFKTKDESGNNICASTINANDGTDTTLGPIRPGCGGSHIPSPIYNPICNAKATTASADGGNGILGGGGGGGAVLNLIEGKGGNGGNGFVILEYKSTMLD